jgi:uncharacterized protein YrzB (UPF0473 family)
MKENGHEVDLNEILEADQDVYEVVFEDGTSRSLILIFHAEYDGKQFGVFVPEDESAPDADEAIVFRLDTEIDGFTLNTPNDEEFRVITEAFNQAYDEEETKDE